MKDNIFVDIQGLGNKQFNMALEILFTTKGELQIDGSRLVKKENINYSQMERELKNTGRKKISKDLDYLIKVNDWQIQDNGDILIPTIKNYFIKSSVPFFQRLVKTISREAVAIFGYLWNKYCYYNNFDFTYDELCREALGITGGTQTKNLDKAKSYLYELVLHGLLTYKIRKRQRVDGKITFRREVIYMTDRFVALDALQKMETQLTEDMIEEKDIQEWNNSEDIEEEEIIVGFQPNIQPQLLQLPTLYLVLGDNNNEKRLLKYSELYLDGMAYSEDELREQDVNIIWVPTVQRAKNNFEVEVE